MDRIPPHAALAESVELTKVSGHSYALRHGECSAAPRRGGSSSIILDPVGAHPAWMIERWKRQFGRDAVASIAAYDQQPPPAAILRWNAELGADRGDDLRPAAF